MLKWMAWMLTPEVQAQVAEYFGEAPANPKACQYLDAGYGSYRFKGFCDKFGVNDPNFYDSDRVLEDAAGRLRRRARPDLHRLLDVDRRRGRRSRAEPEPVDRIAGGRAVDAARAPVDLAIAMTARRHRRAAASLPAAPRRVSRCALYRLAAAALAALLTPPVGWMGVVYFGSLALLFVSAFWYLDPLTSAIVHELQPRELPARSSTEPVYRTIALRTVGMAALVTSSTSLLAFPIAYYMARVASPRTRRLLFMLVLLPLWSSYLVRVYAWRDDPAPRAGRSTGRSRQLGLGGLAPATRDVADAIVFSYLWLPYMILPIYAGLERIPARSSRRRPTSAAAAWTTFRRVVAAAGAARRSWPARSSRSR